MTSDQTFCTDCGIDNKYNVMFDCCWYCGGMLIASEVVECEPEFVSEVFMKHDRLWWEASVPSSTGQYSQIYQTVLPRNYTIIPRFAVVEHWILEDPTTNRVVGIIDDDAELEIFTEDI